MTNHEGRIILSLVVLAALSAGCARSSGPPAGQVEPQRASGDAGVTAEDVQRSPNVPIEQLLAGRIAGVDVSRTSDGGIAVRIRGTSSLTGNNAPLYVLDGIPIEPGPNGSLAGINPYDIASIKVLKDATDLTMYGVRGANGVIVITTKRPNQ